jgi:hypothetical protein
MTNPWERVLLGRRIVLSHHPSACAWGFDQARHRPLARNGLTIRNRLSIAIPSCMSSDHSLSHSAFFPVEFEICRQPPAICAQLVQKILSARLPRNGELAGAGYVNFNFVALLEPQCLHHDRGKANGEAVAPFGDLHEALL